jgi:hypothetical protein
MQIQELADKLDGVKDGLTKDIHKIDVRLARLETSLSIKSAFLGFVAGCVPALIALFK